MKNVMAGVDPGNKNIKVYVDGMKKPLTIENVLYDVTLINAQTDLNTNTISTLSLFKKKQSDPLNLLDVTIRSNGKTIGRKYVGNIALKHGGELRSAKKIKSADNDTFFAMIAALAFPMVEIGKEVKRKVCLGTCLPISEFIHKDNYINHESRLVGKHEIMFNNSYFENASVTIEISKDDLIIVPEGTSALLNIVTGDNGKILDEYEKLQDRIFIIADIGANKSDIIAVREFEPIEEMMSFIDRGIIIAIERVIETLRRMRPDYAITKNDLDYYIREKKSKLIDGENEWDVSSYADNEFKVISKELANRINDLIQKIPSTVRSYIARIVLTGGSSEILHKYISEELDNYKIMLSESCLFDNVLGCYKTAKQASNQKSDVPEKSEK